MSNTQESSSLPSPPPVQPSGRPPVRRSLAFPFVLLIILTLFVGSPWWAEFIAYAWNRGIERAKAEVAAKLLAELPDAEQRIPWVVKKAAPGVVGIHTITQKPTGLGIDVGSGVIVGEDGYILTNYHVIAHAQMIKVKLSDGRETEAMIAGTDRISDLAVLRIEMDNISAIPWGDSRQVSVGDRVVAIGNPYDLQQTVTSGIISATERYGPAEPLRGHHGTVSQEFLQTDAAINPGNSGGALVDITGKLIGINTAILSERGGNSGIGFAIPSFLAKHVYEEIVRCGEMKHGWIGVILDAVREFDAKQMKQSKPAGAVVTQLLPRSPAEKAGIRRGDILLKWGKEEIEDPLHLIHTVIRTRPETKETVEIFRDGQRMTLEITVGQRPVDRN